MKIAFIHQDQKLKTGAGCINSLIAQSLKKQGVEVQNFYPKVKLVDAPHHLKGLNNILFFFSLLEHRNKVLSCDIIQGTTYTPIAFLTFSTPIVSHFGSTTAGFIQATPRTNQIEPKLKKIWHELKKAEVIHELNTITRKPLKDISDIETLVAQRASAIIATSQIIKKNLIDSGVSEDKIYVVHNAIEDFWFEDKTPITLSKPELVYLGRISNDVFTFKLKGLDRLIYAFRGFKNIPKTSILMTTNKKISAWLTSNIDSHTVYTNLYKPEIKEKIKNKIGSILIVPSRYEGFCLSMIEGMSQGLIPVAYPIGVAPEIIKNGKNGYLVNSIEEMNEKIKFILENEEHRQTLALAAMETAKQFSSKKMTPQLLAIYKKLIDEKPNKRRQK